MNYFKTQIFTKRHFLMTFKISIALLLNINFSNKLNAQDFCLTPVQSDNSSFELALQSANAAGPYYLKIYVHVIRQSNGSGGQGEQDVIDALAFLDEDFNPHDIYFIWDCQTNYIDDDVWYQGPQGNATGIFSVDNHYDGIDIYMFPETANSPGGRANGVGSSSEFWVSGTWPNTNIKVAQSHIFSHEMGHVLNLWHTHHGCESGNWELIDGSNCAVAGDYVCDTPSDPLMYFNVDPNTCEWTGTNHPQCDPPEPLENYNPDENAIMAYSFPECMAYFTEGQGERMRNSILTLPYLQAVLTENNTDVCATSACRQISRQTLEKLYNHTNGPNWTNSWDLNEPIENWHGVTLNESGCVKVLDLSNNGLHGTIPKDIGDLEYLTYLDLSDNVLYGFIPNTIANCQRMGFLDLRNNFMDGNIPETISTLPILTFLHLENNRLTGGIPVSFSQMSQLGFLFVNDNNLSECFEPGLASLCSSLNNSSNANISKGNDFTISWEDFCANPSSSCEDLVWPGDLNKDAEVSEEDVLYWAYADGNEGFERPSATSAWTAQASPDWHQNIRGINGKHQDADGDGIVGANDLEVVSNNHGQSVSGISSLQSITSSELNFRLEQLGSDGAMQQFALHLKDKNGAAVTTSGASFTMTSTMAISNIDIVTQNSCFHNFIEYENYINEKNQIAFAISKTDQVDILCDGAIAVFNINLMNSLPLDEMLEISIIKGSTISEGGMLEDIASTSFYSPVMSADFLNTGLTLTVTAIHEQCNSLGKATVQVYGGASPYTYTWSSGHNTPIADNLNSGIYSVLVSDVNGLNETISVQINGQLPVYDSNGTLICGSICPDYLNFTGNIINENYHAAQVLESNGTIGEGGTVSLKAGERIKLKSGFKTEIKTSVKIATESCQ